MKSELKQVFTEIRSSHKALKQNLVELITKFHKGSIFLKNLELDTPKGLIVKLVEEEGDFCVITEKGYVLAIDELSNDILIEIGEKVAEKTIFVDYKNN